VAQQRQVFSGAMGLAGCQKEPHGGRNGAQHFQPFAFTCICYGNLCLVSRRSQIPVQERQVVRAPCIQDRRRLNASIAELSVYRHIPLKTLIGQMGAKF
jgi:hypothetical protein